MKLKKFAAVLAALCMMLNTAPLTATHMSEVVSLSASAEETGTTQQGLYYTKFDDHVVITKAFGTASTEIEIPAEIDGVPVTEIQQSAFEKKDNITSIIIPDSVTNIGYHAFFSCDGLTSIVIS